MADDIRAETAEAKVLLAPVGLVTIKDDLGIPDADYLNTILLERERINRQTIRNRGLMHARTPAETTSVPMPSPGMAAIVYIFISGASLAADASLPWSATTGPTIATTPGRRSPQIVTPSGRCHRRSHTPLR
jgi:hypothetical protein